MIDLLRQILGILQRLNAAILSFLPEWQQARLIILSLAGLPDLNAMATSVSDIQSQINNVTWGLQALHNQMATQYANILAAIGNPQQATAPVVLPASPPSGYGGPSTNEIGDAVWLYYLDPVGDMGEALATCRGILGTMVRWNGLPNPRWPYLTPLFGENGVIYDADEWVPPVDLDITTILPTDTSPLGWVRRAYPSDAWVETYPTYQGVAWYDDSPGGGKVWGLTMSQAEFERIKATLYPSLTPAPLWPGLDHVVLGTPVALAAGVTITVPMDGVIVEITAAPVKQGYFTFDDVVSWRNIGALAFFSDNGDEEFPQQLGFQHAVYVPRSMTSASGVKIRCSAGVAGTVTPWTRS
jgi:hypothetical protein